MFEWTAKRIFHFIIFDNICKQCIFYACFWVLCIFSFCGFIWTQVTKYDFRGHKRKNKVNLMTHMDILQLCHNAYKLWPQFCQQGIYDQGTLLVYVRIPLDNFRCQGN